MPQPSLMKLVPGVGAHATPRTRNPVNFPRTWGKSVVRPVPGYVYHAYDTIAFSDTQGAAPTHASDALTFSDTTSGPGYRHASDALTFSDTAVPGQHTSTSSSDALTFSDAAAGASGLMPQPSLMKLVPGVGAHATPRTRNPVNFPRTFRTSRVSPPEQLSYGAYDTIPFSDSATRPAQAYSKTAADSLSFSDAAKPAVKASDALTFSDAATWLRPSDAASDTFSFVDSAYGFKTFARTASDTLSFSDAAIRDLTGAGSDTLSFSDAAAEALKPVDSLAFSDAASHGPVSFTRHGADSLSFSDRAVGTTGRNNLTASDTLTFRDSTVAWTYDTITFNDYAQAGPVFFAGTDILSFSDTAGPSGFVTNARVYQVYEEIIFQNTGGYAYAYQTAFEVATKPPSTAYDYQTGLEVAVKPPATAHALQMAEEVAVGHIYGQIWPIGWGFPRSRYGQLWPRWSRDYKGGMGQD